MKYSTFSLIWAFFYTVFGLGLLLVPVPFMSAYDVVLDQDGSMIARILGAALFAYAIVFWLNRKSSPSDKGVYNLMLASVIYNVVDIPIVLMATLDGTMNAMGWMPVILHTFLAVSMWYFVFGNKALPAK